MPLNFAMKTTFYNFDLINSRKMTKFEEAEEYYSHENRLSVLSVQVPSLVFEFQKLGQPFLHPFNLFI